MDRDDLTRRARLGGLTVEHLTTEVSHGSPPTEEEIEQELLKVESPIPCPPMEARKASVVGGFVVMTKGGESAPLVDALADLARRWAEARTSRQRKGPASPCIPRAFEEPPPLPVIESCPRPVLEILCTPEPDLTNLSKEAQAFFSRWAVECLTWRWAVEQLMHQIAGGTELAPTDYLPVRFHAVLVQLHFVPEFITALIEMELKHGLNGKRADHFLGDFMRFKPNKTWQGNRLLALSKLLESPRQARPGDGNSLLAYLRVAVGNEAGRLQAEADTGGRHWKRIEPVGDPDIYFTLPEAPDPADIMIAREEFRLRKATKPPTPALDRLLQVGDELLRLDRTPPEEKHLIQLLLEGYPPADAIRQVGCSKSAYVNLLQKSSRLHKQRAA